MIEIFTLAFLAVAVGKFVAWLGIMFRFAIPRAPILFRIALTVPMLASVASALGVCYTLLEPEGTTVLGLDLAMLVLIYVLCHAAFLWIMNIYAVYWYFIGRRRCPA